MAAVYILLTFATIFLIIGQINNADIIVGVIKGFMIGILYHEQEYEDNVTEYTLQCLIGVISLNVIWSKNIKE